MKTISLNLTFLLILFLSVHAVAQESEAQYEDVLYLKNGSVLRGKLTHFGDDTLTFETWSGVQMQIAVHDMQKLVQEQKFQPRARRPSEFQFKETGIYHYASMGFSAGPEAGFSLTHVIGYRWSRLISAGFGIGAENFELGYGRRLMPVFGEFRAFLSDKNIAPMVAMRAGYGFAFRNENANITRATGGVLLAPEFGYRFGGRNAQFTLSASLHFQWAKYTEAWDVWGGGSFTDHMRYQRLELKTGLLF